MTNLEIENLKILVIEDEENVRTIIKQILKQVDFHHIYDAEEGGSGFTHTMRLRPDLVLCDIHMAPVDGLSYLSMVRKAPIPEVRGTRVIFLTGDAQAEVVQRARGMNVNGYMVKPVSVNDVKKTLGRVLDIEIL